MKKLGSNLFVVLPPRNNEKPVDLIIAGKMKIYEHTTESNEKNYSFGFTLSEDQREAFQNIEKRTKHLANESKPTVKKLSPKFANFHSDDFQIIKTDSSEFSKVYSKLYCKNDRITCPFSIVVELSTVPKNRSKGLVEPSR